MFFACNSFGADHDGNGNAASCTVNNFIMAPADAYIDEKTAYSDNPWRFSSCSIAAFKAFYQTLKNNNKYELCYYLCSLLF